MPWWDIQSSRKCFWAQLGSKVPINLCPKVNRYDMDILRLLKELLRISGFHQLTSSRVGIRIHIVTGIRQSGRFYQARREGLLRHIVDLEDNILEMLHHFNCFSSKDIRSVWRTFHDFGLYPLKAQTLQALQPPDNIAHVEFCHWILVNQKEIFIHRWI
jgi:hypothetical protein